MSGRLAGSPGRDVADRLRGLQSVLTPPAGRDLGTGGAATGLPAWLPPLFLLVAAQAALAWVGLVVGGPAAPGSPTWLLVVTAVVYLVTSAVLVNGRRLDRRAVWLGAFLLAIASAASQRPLGWLTAAAGGGRWLGHLLPEALAPLFLWRFVRDFPEVVHLSRWSGTVRAGLALSAVVGGVLAGANGLLAFVPPSSIRLVLLSRSGPLYWAVISALVLAALVIAGLRALEASRQERRRVALLLAGFCGGVGPGFLLILLEETLPGVAALSASPQGRLVSDLVVYVPLLAVPVLASHAVLAEDAFGLGTMLRRAILPATAEYVAAVSAAVVASLLVVHLLVNRERNVGVVLTEAPAPVLLTAGAVAGAVIGLRRFAVWRRRVWADATGESGGALVSSFAQDVSRARSRMEVLGLLSDRVRDALGVESADMWLPDGEQWASSNPVTEPLRADSAILALARSDPAPMRIDPSDGRGLFGWLPEEEKQWVCRLGVRLLVPLAGDTGELAALVGVADPERSRFSEEAVSLVGALASSAALALRPASGGPDGAGRADAADAAAECLACGRVGRAGGRCPQCGGGTRTAAIPHELNGRFRVLQVLGRGGMGVAYKAVDLALEREVALKTLPRVHAEALSRFRREALSMARFVDPHLALIFGLETWRGVPVLVVEYLAGGTLAARMGAPQPAGTVARWGAQLSAGLEAMHAEGLLHRDVKPSNVGFTIQGTVKLLDFGLARLVAEIDTSSAMPGSAVGETVTRTSHVVGTPLYLAPEALAGEPPCPAHDLWALALVLWEALAGKHPFGQPMSRHPGRQLDLRRSVPGASLAWADLLESALSPDVRARPGSAAEVRRRLEELLLS